MFKIFVCCFVYNLCIICFYCFFVCFYFFVFFSCLFQEIFMVSRICIFIFLSNFIQGNMIKSYYIFYFLYLEVYIFIFYRSICILFI